jgi:two-component system, OmpR family, sensor kinase
MRWYRSLYWRIAFGVIGFLAAMLVVQAMLFVWAVSQSGRSLPGQSPMRLGVTVALDLANLLERDPQADVARYVHDQYAQYTHPFFVMLTDGRVVTSGSTSFPDQLLRLAREQLDRRLERPDRPDRPERGDRWRMERPDGPRPRIAEPGDRGGFPGRAGDRLERGPGGMAFVRPAPILVGGRVAGIVVVPPQAPFGFLLGRFAPMLALVAGGVLVLGTVVTSLMIFGPARRRLRALETAARRLGSGDLSARAPDRGGDEIAAVASAFNAMAGDLSARAEALAASDRTRRQLLADVSHELTTPVTAMRGYLETLSMPELTLDEATRNRYLSIISDETNRLERLIGDLLELARLEGGGGSLAIDTVRVADLFERVRARHEPACRAAGVAIEATIEPGAETVRGDRNRLEQALQNLASNAMRYAPQGSVVRLIARPAGSEVPASEAGSEVLAAPAGSEVSAGRVGSEVPAARAGSEVPGGRAGSEVPEASVRPQGPPTPISLSVEDSGTGIPAEHLPHIFDRFYKADASRAGVSGGSGLGLSIVKAIVERHGGTISVASEPGRTVFQIVLPAR